MGLAIRLTWLAIAGALAAPDAELPAAAAAAWRAALFFFLAFLPYNDQATR